MRAVWIIAKRELDSFFDSLIAYILLVLFLTALINGGDTEEILNRLRSATTAAIPININPPPIQVGIASSTSAYLLILHLLLLIIM